LLGEALVAARRPWIGRIRRLEGDGSINSTRINVLIVADQTADSPRLRDAVTRRAREGPCSFTLLVPRLSHRLHQVVDPKDDAATQAFARLRAAVPLLSQAAGRPIVGMIGSHEPLATIQDALNLLGFDEVILSMPPARISQSA